MNVIKVLYNKDTAFIKDIVNQFKEGNIIEFYNADMLKELKKMRPIQTRFGSHKFPLIVFEDENLIEVAAIWSESNPDWENAIKECLKK